MKHYNLKLVTLSPLHLGSGRADIVIDAEVVHDTYGLPYFPARRFKGLLYESALEMAEISQEAWFTADDVKKLFGRKDTEQAVFLLDNLYLADYETLRQSWAYLNQKYPELFTRKAVLESYTDVRYQTAIDASTGTTKDGSLHNMRVVDANTVFTGALTLTDDSTVNTRILEYGIKNLRFAGAKRTRGCGRISCTFL